MKLSRRAWLSGLAATTAGAAVRARATPARVFDAHFHIIDPGFPLVPNQGFEPAPFPVDAYLANVAPLGVTAGAVVAGSFQGYDQSFMLDALRRLGTGWVGVAQIPPDMPDDEIIDLARSGVRALRFNMQRGDVTNFAEIMSLALRAYAVAGWHAEFYVDAAMLRPHVDQLAQLPVYSIDHLGLTEAGLPVLIDLASGGAYVKASGFGRTDMNVSDALERIAARNPNALVFGSDLPSTRAKAPFKPADIELISTVLGAELSRKVFWDNAVRLYRVQEH